MNRSSFSWAIWGLFLALTIGAGALAQGQKISQYGGIINDFTPVHDGKGNASGPWELHGSWGLIVRDDAGLANFTATLTMEDSDFWVLMTTPPPNPDDPGSRTPHTHRITMKNAQVTWLDSTNMSSCPTSSYKPDTTSGFMITGSASVSANGGFAPFAPQGQLSPLQVCITGGSRVAFSNITLVFGAPASGHFGMQPINGAVNVRK